MKNIIKVSLAGLGLLASASSFAAGDSALIPHVMSDDKSNMQSYFYFTNVSDAPIDVTVSLYNNAGQLITESSDSASAGVLRAYFSTVYSESGSGSAQMTIEPNATVTLHVTEYGNFQGYGRVEWTQDSNVRDALISHGRVYRHNNGYEMSYSVHINKGEEF
ncbi:hypothetical protein OE749_01625 [Aestuariibacter sp. AA17]|uniref:Uncharacterized protein n=1 Tax=Fluctibacter corallii TaxID=2984329 RepID=A0ABT3A4T8_9ALTE|nr:hypothetical protein [Aestuariibacter sp. AA17]MCV2883396.1 hypothetical protein [Aestuariibacter sp. AA17]